MATQGDPKTPPAEGSGFSHTPEIQPPAPAISLTVEGAAQLIRAASGIQDDKTPIEPLLMDDAGNPAIPYPMNQKAVYDKRRGFEDKLIATMDT